MDVEMPEMDGLAATRRIRQAETSTGGHLPIIAMTAHAMRGDRERFLAAGMDDHVTKPIRPRDLFLAIERLRPGAGQPPPSAPSALPAPSTAAPTTADTPLFSFEETIAYLQGDTELLRQLLELFERDGPRRMADIERAIREGNAGIVRRRAHSLKGSTGTLAAHPAYELAAHLEALARSSPPDWRAISEAAGQLREMLTSLIRQMHAAVD